MQYQRFISYLYQYKDGEKVQNTGYVKVEQRGSRIRLSLRSKIMEGNEPVYYVYLVSKAQEAGHYGVLLDRLTPSQGLLTYQYIIGQNQNFVENQTIDDFIGVLVRGERAMYMTLWQDAELLPEYVICLEGAVPESTGETDGMYMQGNAETAGGMYMENNAETAGSMYMENNAETAGGMYMENDAEAAGQIYIGDNAQALGINGPDGGVQTSKREGGQEQTNFSETEATDIGGEQVPAESAAAESAPVGGEEYRSGADYLFKNRNSLPAVEGSQLLDCIRIEPQDLGLLHMQNWRYGNNSFLNHGYYRYRYLLLGKLKFQDNSVKIILGVPSIYTNKEKYLANMFGFDQFVTARRTDRKLGQFGYWLVELTS